MSPEVSAKSGSPLSMVVVRSRMRDPGHGLRPVEGPYPLTPALSPWERGHAVDAARGGDK